MLSKDAAQPIFFASTKWIDMITFASVGSNKSQYFLNNVSGDMKGLVRQFIDCYCKWNNIMI